ncbi:MAG: ATP-binding protein [Clostridia bacterium]|nr:ATP-binding protein [Clostridia bacterium]
MGIGVFILGESGSGKTYSVKGLNPNDCKVFSVKKGTLPFPTGKDYEIVKKSDYASIWKELQNPTKKTYVIDDSQYLMVDEFFRKANDTGYKKYTDIGKNFSTLLEAVEKTPDDVIVYFLHHTQTTSDGRIKAKTVGQMLDSYLTLEGCVDVCLIVRTDGKEHWFDTQSDGITTAKSPEGMFEIKIPNDLGIVDAAIRNYYGL